MGRDRRPARCPGTASLAGGDPGTGTGRTALNYSQQQRVNNLSVSELHTYYVEAGSTPVLVHNSGCGDPYITPERVTHIKNRHFEGGKDVDTSAGTFTTETTEDDLHDIAEMGAGVTPSEDADGNFARIIDVGRLVGNSSPLTGGAPTSMVRLIQRNSGYVVTMHPW